MIEPEFITHDFKLPSHANEISHANDRYSKLKTIFNKHKKNSTLTDDEFINLYEDIIRVLDYVGNLSKPAYNVQKELEELYKYKYLHAPQLGKTLWLNHYSKIHHPYNLIKNRCFILLEELDKYYISMYDKLPPNWKP